MINSELLRGAPTKSGKNKAKITPGFIILEKSVEHMNL